MKSSSSSRSKIVFVLPDFFTGGVERVLIVYLTALAKLKKYDLCLVVTGFVENNFLLKSLPKEVELISWPQNSQKPQKGFKRKIWKLKHWWQSICRRNFLQKIYAEADFLIDFKNNYSLSSYKPLPHQKKIVWFHGKFDSVRKRLKPRLVGDYAAIIGLSRAFMTDCQKQYPKIADKVRFIYNPLDIDQIRASASRPIAAAEQDLMQQPYFVHVSRIAGDKDISTLMAGYQKFVNRLAAPAPKLCLIGDGPQMQYWQDYVSARGWQDKILLLGEKENPYVWMKNAEALILSSKGEGFGCVLIEALACGTPVISADCPSAPAEILQHGRLGQLFAAGSADDLAQKLFELHTGAYTPPQPEYAEKAIAKFKTENILSQFTALLDSLK